MPYSKQSSSWSESWFKFSPEVTTNDQCKSFWWFSRWLIFSIERFRPRQRHSTQWWSKTPAGAYGREECQSSTFHRSFHCYNLCLSSTTLPRMSIKSSLIWLHSTKTSRKCSTYSRISPSQIGRDGGGHYMYPACKCVAVIIQEFDDVNPLGSFYVRKTQFLEAEDSEPYTCSARPQWQFQLCRIRYKVEAVYPAGIKEPGSHHRPVTNVRSCGGEWADLRWHPAHTE